MVCFWALKDLLWLSHPRCGPLNTSIVQMCDPRNAEKITFCFVFYRLNLGQKSVCVKGVLFKIPLKNVLRSFLKHLNFTKLDLPPPPPPQPPTLWDKIGCRILVLGCFSSKRQISIV